MITTKNQSSWITYFTGLAGLITIALITFKTGLSLLPFDADNLIALTLGTKANPIALFGRNFLSYLPAYRPLPYLSIWMQYQITGLNPKLLFFFNQLVWISCALALFSLLFKMLDQWKVIAFIPALFFLLDIRALSALVWIGERQSSMACLLGLLAILLAVSSFSPALERLKFGAIFLLLVMSTLSKEYGLAFIGFLFLYAWFDNWKKNIPLFFAAGLAAMVYFALRFLVAGGAMASFCEDMGYFQTVHRVCYDQLSFPVRLQQYGYNVFASFLATLFPNLFGLMGNFQLGQKTAIIFQDLFIFGFALLAWIRQPRKTLPFLGLILINAILNFLLFRGRNQVIGMAGLYAAFGFGLAFLSSSHPKVMPATLQLIRSLAVVIALGIFSARSLSYFQVLQEYQGTYASLNPCTAYQTYLKDINLDVVREIKDHYQLGSLECAP